MSRNLTIDVYRGFVMLLMMAEVLRLPRLARDFPGNALLDFAAFHQSHVEWAGASLHDMIQPSFSFLVGVALPYSLNSRLARGFSPGRIFWQTLWRSLALIAMGIFLRSTHATQTNFTFEDTLTQIGLGYPFLVLLGMQSRKIQWSAFATILFCYWLSWALYSIPGQPFAAHWWKADNLGVAFDAWFLNLFPRATPFVANGGGYVTLSFVPTLTTMLLGLIAGEWMRAGAPLRKYLQYGAGLITAGLLLHFSGVCPIVKRIWTPAWTLFSGGICLIFLAAFAYVLEIRKWTAWTFPLVVIGMNSIAAYWIAHVLPDFISSSLKIHFNLAIPALVLAIEWLILYWMYRRQIFLKV